MCLMPPLVIIVLRSSQSFFVGLGTVYVEIRHRLAPAFSVLTVVVCLTTSWWVYPPLTAIVTGSISPLTKAAILVLVMFHIGSCDVSHSARSSACVAEADASASPFLAIATCTARWRLRTHLPRAPPISGRRPLRVPLDGGCVFLRSLCECGIFSRRRGCSVRECGTALWRFLPLFSAAYASAPPFLAVASHRLVVVVRHHICAAIPGFSALSAAFGSTSDLPCLHRHPWVRPWV